MDEKIREVCRELLDSQKVDRIIGYANGTISREKVSPIIIKSADEADRLIFNQFCINNLSKYLTKYLTETAPKAGIVAKGCDVRSIIQLISEHQIKRENIFIIGVVCDGVIDIKKHALGQSEGTLADRCKVCNQHIPAFYDILIGEQKEYPRVEDPHTLASGIESLSLDERWAYWREKFSRCIRCYACRNACPMCYCRECFVDISRPQWVWNSVDLSQNMMYHIIRAYHQVGRCTNCGECERACPMGIPLREIADKLVKDMEELFGYEAGVDMEATVPLAIFKEDDLDEFK